MKDEILAAIQSCMGINIEQIQSHSRKRKLVFARFIYSHHRFEDIADVEVIAAEIHRDRNTIDYYLAKYDEDYAGCKMFRVICDQVKEVLNEGNADMEKR